MVCVMAREKAGMSSGLRLVMKLASVATSRSTRLRRHS